MDYEKGAPRNLVQFSEYNDLAFTDTGVSINDNSKPSKNVLWSSEKIERKLNEIMRGGMHVGMHGGVNVSAGCSGGYCGSKPRPVHNLYYDDGSRKEEFYPNGYRIYARHTPGHRLPRLLKPSWWLSFVIPSRAHYCDKCCNYMSHTWATKWNDDPTLNNWNCSSGNKSHKAITSC